VPAAGATGPAVQVPTTGNLTVGQNASLSFSGIAGQKLSFNVVNSTISSSVFTLYDPNQTSLISHLFYTGTSYMDTVTLTVNGTYMVYLDPQGTATGSVSVSINNDQDVTTPAISIGGSVVTAQTRVAGQDVRLSFTPTSSQPRIAVLVTGVTNPLAVLNPVNASQQYQLWVRHDETNFGKESLQIKTVPADISHTVTVGGAAYNFSTVIGQNANIQFTITTSESVTVHWTSGTYPSTLGCNMAVTGPSPSTNQIAYGSCNTATGTVSLGTPSAGTYNILVDPQAQSAGGMSLTVTTP
jgi:hypothetical protein